MMNSVTIKSMEEAIEKFQNIQDHKMFRWTMKALQDYMKELGMSKEEFLELERRAYYLQNEYSNKATNDNMETAKYRVISYIENILNNNLEDENLLKILNNFYLFLENLVERKPHKSAGIQTELLMMLKIKNEYDVQHLLYACIKLFYPMARAEVSEDTGYGTVRTDIFVDAEHVIEIKCTRENMKLKKLIEEIDADMIHYSAKNIYFFLYDKAKIIENSMIFKRTYEKKINEKKIHIVIHQPKIL